MFKFTPTDEWYDAATALEEDIPFIGAGGDPNMIEDECKDCGTFLNSGDGHNDGCSLEPEICPCCMLIQEFCNCIRFEEREKLNKIIEEGIRLVTIMNAIEIVRQMNSIDDAVSALEDMKQNA